MALNGPLILRDAQGKLLTDTGNPVGFNGGTPVTIDRKLTITDTGGPWKVAGLEYDIATRLAESIIGPAINWIAGVPLNAGGEVWAEDAPVLFYAPNAIPITASGAVAMSVGIPPGGLPPLELADSVTTSDNFTFVLSTSRLITDEVFITDSIGFAVSTNSLADTASPTDAITKSITKALSDAATTTDALNQSTDKSLADATTSIDSIAFQSSKELTDSIVTIDNIIASRVVDIVLTDNVTTVDNIDASEGTTQALADSVNATDNLTVILSQALGDGASAIDNIAIVPLKALGDSASAIDSIILGLGLSQNLVDSISSIDNITIVLSQALVDTASAIDAISLTPSKDLADSTTSTDGIIKSLDKVLADTISSVDNVTAPLSINRTLVDNVVTVDDVTASLPLTASLSDSITTTDNVTPVHTPGSALQNIVYVGGQVGNRAGSTSTTLLNFALTGGIDTTPRTDDLVIINCVVGTAARNPALAFTDYNLVGLLNQGGATADTSLQVAWLFSGPTPDTAVTIPATGNIADGQAYSVQVFRNVDINSPFDTASVSAGATGTGRPDPAAITPVTPGAWVVACAGGAAATGANYIAPANFTTNFLTSFGADTTDAMVGSGYWSGWTSGAADPGVYTGGTTNAADSWCSWTLALRPAPVVVAMDNPADLFAQGEGGMWFDFSDLSTMFQDTAGTVPVTAVGQSVARVNDKSGRGNHATQATAGNRPKLEARINAVAFSEDLANAAWLKTLTTVTSNVAAAPTSLGGAMTADGIIPSASAGLHWVQYTTPTVPASGKFCYSVYVKTGPGGSGRCSIVCVSGGTAEMYVSLTIATSAVTMATSGSFPGTVSGYGADTITADGWVRVWIAGNPDITTTTRRFRVQCQDAAGQANVAFDGTTTQLYVYGAQIEPGVGPPSRYQRSDSDTVYDTVGFPLYLNFDGVDDGLATAAIDPAIDKATIWLGVYKAMDSQGTQSVFESSSDPNANPGTMGIISANDTFQGTYSFRTRGVDTLKTGETPNSFPSPRINVLAARLNNGGANTGPAKITGRVNGVQQTLTFGGTGGFGNYASHPFYIGRRGGTVIPFNGRIYGIIARFYYTPAQNIAEIEQWMADKAGISF